jgi:hypothetical protein
VSYTVTVNPAPLTITASSPSALTYGAAIPTVTAGYSAFVGTDTKYTGLTTRPTCTTAYTTTSAPTTYTTTCSGAAGANYSITYVPGSFTVGKASQTINFWNSSTTYGTAVTLGATSTSGLSVSYSVSGPATFSAPTLTPTGVGAVTVTASQAGNSDYLAATSVQKTVTIYQVGLVVAASSPSAVVYGTAVPAVTATYTGLVNGELAPTTAATCKTSYTTTSIPGTYSTYCYGAVDANYSITYTSGSLTVNKAPATVTNSPTAATIAYGYTLNSSALTNGQASVPGTFAWTTPATIPHVNGSAQSVTFTPTASTDYTTQTVMVPITVTAVNPTITALPTASSIPYDSALSASNLSGGVASFTLPSTVIVAVPGTFKWTTYSTVLTAISTTNSEGFTFTPTGTYAADYNPKTGNVNVTVTKATPTVSAWPTAGAINYGAALSTSSLSGGTASVAGTFAWANGATVPVAGTPSESVTFTPSTPADYSTVTGTVKVTVNKATPSVSSWPTASAITYGQTLASSTLSGGSTAGRFAWTTPSTVPDVGGPAQSVTFTPTNSTDYGTVTNTVAVTVNPAATTVSLWPTATAITLGQSLSSSDWATSGTASTDGSFSWTDTTIQPGVGTWSESVTFAPGSGNYISVNGWVNITVNACGKQDSANSAFSTALFVYTGGENSTDPTLDAEGSNESAICAVNSDPSNATIVTYPFITSNAASTYAADSSSYGTDAAVLAYGLTATQSTGATITINDDGSNDPGSISTSQDNSHGAFASMGGTVNITDTVISTSGNSSHALAATYEGTLNITNVQAITTGNNSSVIAAGIGGGNVTVAGGTYMSTGSNSAGIRVAGTGSTVAINDGTASGTAITAQSGPAVVIEGGNSVTITSNGSTSLSGALGSDQGIYFYYNPSKGDATAGASSFTMVEGSITYTCDATDASLAPCPAGLPSNDQNSPATLFSVANTTAAITLTDVTVTNTTPTDSNANGTLLTAAALNSGTNGSNGGHVTFNAIGETLTGDVIVDAISTAHLSLAADTQSVSSLTGAINAANSGGTVSLTLDATSSWVVANGSSYLTSLTNAGSGNITCLNTDACSVYVGGILQTGIN